MDKVSKNALIWTALYGDSFGSAACHSFKLLWRNAMRVAAINIVAEYLLTFGKFFVAAVTTLIAVLIYECEPYRSDMSSYIVPACFIFIIAFAIAWLVMLVYEAIIDTIFLCFLVDSEKNKDGIMMASKSLQALVGKYEKNSAALSVKADTTTVMPAPAGPADADAESAPLNTAATGEQQ